MWLGRGKRVWRSEPVFPSFYFPNFFLQAKKPWFTHEYMEEVNIKVLQDFLKTYPVDSIPKIFWNEPKKPIFEKAFYSLQAQFNAGVLQKGVPYIFKTTPQSPSQSQLVNFLRNILNYASRHPVFAYGFWDETKGMVGATPELLFELKNRTFKTMACAGTCPLANSSTLAQDDKMIKEHHFVLDGIHTSLRDYGEITRGSLEILPLSTLCHLVTKIKLEIKEEVPLKNLIAALHPTPALGTFPKKEGMEWLTKFGKKHPRGRFGAPVGFFSESNKAFCYVAIRNVQWSRRGMKIGAGCGIIQDSDLESEWKEIQLKLKSIRNILNI